KRIDAVNGSGKLAQYALIAATKQARQGTIEHRSSGLGNRMPATRAGQSAILLHARLLQARQGTAQGTPRQPFCMASAMAGFKGLP
ncbi:MAG: hypothetical protein ABI227_11180, partial [Rhodanobacter sp.]